MPVMAAYHVIQMVYVALVLVKKTSAKCEPKCLGNSSRTIYPGDETRACTKLTTEASCESGFQEGTILFGIARSEVTSCYWNGAACQACSSEDEGNGLCANECRRDICEGDISNTTFVGGPGSGACRVFGGNQTACDSAYHLGLGGIANCGFEIFGPVVPNLCSGCGLTQAGFGNCVNECLPK